jgi:dinuclear metal center YbgI/SA1388 family protein
VIAHHPILFKGIKKLNGKNYVERALITAVKNDIAIYACHTNIDNVLEGVNGKMADRLGLINREILAPKSGIIRKLQVFVPQTHVQVLEKALFEAGAGYIGNYSECSFVSEGTGGFKAESGANPFVGALGDRHVEKETKVEVLFPLWIKDKVMKAMYSAHPYEEVAYEVSALENEHQHIGSGLIGEWPEALYERDALEKIKSVFGLKVIRHTSFIGKKIKKVAICGGSGSFLTGTAIARGADLYITADVKYHEFFDADRKLILADIGHFESEQYTIELFADVLRQKFPTFALLNSEMNTNPVHYFI